MTLSALSLQATALQGHERLNEIVTSHSVMIACQKLEGRYDAALACYEAMRRLRVFTMQDIATEANRHGFDLDAGSAQIQIGRLCRALAHIMGATECIDAACNSFSADFGPIYTSLLVDVCRLANSLCPDTATEFDRIERDADRNIVYRLRRGLCRV